MRIAALYDVHGNLPALRAVLAEVEDEAVDATVSGGDVVWGAQPAECLRLLRAAGALFVRGNCEREVARAADDVARWCAGRLADDERRFVADGPLTVLAGGVLFCHATPRSDEEVVTSLAPDSRLADAFGGAGAAIVVCGHTHRQFDRRVDGLRVVNAGSVGLPYEGAPGAYWALVEGEDVELRRTEYDAEAAVRAAETAGFPQPELVRGALLEPPDPDEVAAGFEAGAGA